LCLSVSLSLCVCLLFNLHSLTYSPLPWAYRSSHSIVSPTSDSSLPLLALFYLLLFFFLDFCFLFLLFLTLSAANKLIIRHHTLLYTHTPPKQTSSLPLLFFSSYYLLT
ncbi:hypothetical protein BKA57DRAFT_451080, partial [Linnemannia elongata]